jgi:histidyl-tRNA synthetase
LKFEAPRGTHDILPSEQPVWQLVTGEAEQLCSAYGYRRIQTPVFEDTSLFARTSGQGSDVVQKEMYTFTDRGERSLTLRPEATAPICRAYLEHGLHREPQPQKLYTIATMYRYAAPQRGRYREHWQLSVEAIGSDDPAVDAEVIQLYDALLGKLGISAYELKLNSIGDAVCRPAYLDRLRAWLAEHGTQLDADTRAKAEASLLRVFDNFEAKPPAVQAALSGAPKIGESLCDACAAHFGEVRAFLDAYGVPYELDPTLVRGLDYYTRTTWEFVGPEAGAQSTLSGGGRYDGLVEEIGGAPTPGVGFGAGIERLVAAVESAAPQELAGARRLPDLFFLVEPGADRVAALAEMTKLRRAGVSCETDYARRSVKGQWTQLSRSGATGHVLVTGDGAVIKRNREADEIEVPVAEIASTVLG